MILDRNNIYIIIISFIIIILGQIIGIKYQFIARKFVHICIGLVLMNYYKFNYCDKNKIEFYLLLVLLIISILTKPFNFCHLNKIDFGIPFYVLIIIILYLQQIPLKNIAPFFLADPMGAIIGKNIYSPILYGKKTIAGTLTVITVSYICFSLFNQKEINNFKRILWSILIGIVEGIGGEIDNLLIGLTLILKYKIENT
jgi:dolichol kinase